jgi:sirohydrochlorin cobaltochelatase
MTNHSSSLPALFLVGHGSRDIEGNQEFLALAERLRRARPDRHVYSGFVELAEPLIAEELDRCARDGHQEVVVLPVLFFAAGHAKTDVPTELRRARERHPGVHFHYGPPLGIHPILLDLVTQRVTEVERGLPPKDRAETAILLVGRGSSDPDANGDLLKIARLYWEQTRYGWVETCFIGVTHPDLPSGIDRCLRLGASRIIAIPYFIFTGILIKRINRIVEEIQAGTPGVEIVAGDYLGRHPAFLEVVEQRARETLEGPILMHCDTCKYRDPDLVFGGVEEGHHHGH